jgi:hypothetical protein
MHHIYDNVQYVRSLIKISSLFLSIPVQILGFASLLATAVTVHELSNKICSGNDCNFPNSARFLLLVAIGVVAYEAAAVTVRFINFNIIAAFSKIVFIMVSQDIWGLMQ